MNDDQFKDLKQLIETTAAYTEANLKRPGDKFNH
jgi:hypothetical protein